MGCAQSHTVSEAPAAPLIQAKAKKTKQRNQKSNKNALPEVIEPQQSTATYATYLSSHDATLQMENACSLRGVTFMANGNLIVADYKNNKLKLFSSSFEFLADLELQSAPWDVCQVTDIADDILATVPYKQEVHRVKVTIVDNCHKLIPVSDYRTDGFCWGITSFDGGVAVCIKVPISDKPWPKPPEYQVHVHEMDGTFRRAIMYDANTTPLFIEPKYLNVTYDNIYLLVSDYKQNTVLCINNEDELIFSYAGMKSPNGIAMDEGKNLHIVSFFGRERVHKVGANGAYKDGLPHNEDRPLFPHGICYRKKDKIIVMTTDRSLEVYTLV